jgi:hypothetical protein
MPNWPRQSECRAFYGAPGTGHTTIALPYPVRLAWQPKTTLSRFTIHRKCAASALKVLNQVKDAYGVEKIRELGLDLWDGCYVNRPMRGGKQPSMHAYACAIDWDGDHNQLKWDHRRARLAKPVYDAWWQAWEAEGWVSLGRTRDFDWMQRPGREALT